MNEGGYAQVSCIVTEGDEPLTINWSFHGHALSDNLGIVTIPMGTRGSSLMIPKVNHQHSGSYSCQAANSVGKETKTVLLTVNGETYKNIQRSQGHLIKIL